jgi:DNA-directed RNA polymerase subunit alpha
MPVRLGRFEMPKRLTKDESTSTDTYAKFIAEPFETGYGHTVGNSLRRVLLSSLEGAAITSIKIDGAMHEFATVEGVVEDVTDIVLNLKKVLFTAHTRDPQTLLLSANKEGDVTAADIQLNQNVELVNPTQHICTLDKKKKFEMELEVKVGRGFMPGDENKKPNQAIGVVAIDSLFSPVTRVRYFVESARVGQRTDYDRLVLEVWTDGRISPDGRREVQAQEVAQHERERDRAERPRGELLEQREHYRRRSVGDEERKRNAQVSQLRQEVVERNQGQADGFGSFPRHELRA